MSRATGPGAQRIPALSRADHDRAGLRRRDPDWLAGAWPDARVLVLAADGTTPVHGTAGHDTAGPAAPRLLLRPAVDVDPALDRLFLGLREDVAYFAVVEPEESSSDGGADPTGDRAGWLDLRALGGVLDDLDAGLFTAAVALSGWHRSHRHCPRCGSMTEVIDGGWARACPRDGSQHFPRTDPAVIMLVHDGGDRVVLGRQAVWPTGRFSILAGFVEAGEAAEATVAREVHEEVGLRVTDVEYRSSQPWPFPASLMLGFTARAVGDLTITRHDDELDDAAWFTRSAVRQAASWDDGTAPTGSRLVALPGGISIARHLLDAWLDA